MLFDEGRRAAAAFLEEDGASLGKHSSFDFDALLDGDPQ
jgi:NTE family protein